MARKKRALEWSSRMYIWQNGFYIAAQGVRKHVLEASLKSFKHIVAITTNYNILKANYCKTISLYAIVFLL